MKRRTTTNGHDLLNEFEATIADILSRASDRAQDVENRLSELEAEKSSLSKVHALASGV